MAKRILMIVTSNSRMGSTEHITGIWSDEFAIPYYAFIDAGIEVVIASPAGGRAPIDPVSLNRRGQNDPAVERYLDDAFAYALVQSTFKVSELDMDKFDGVFFCGGHGTMWDLPVDPSVTRAVETANVAGKLIASVCHGGAGLVSARRPDGRPVVEGIRISSFTNDEEKEVGLTEVMPFLLETRLRELGCKFEKVASWQPYAIRDGQFITGQNPSSSGLAAQLVLEAFTVSPVGEKQYATA